MKKRKLLSMFLIAALSTALIAGCSSKKVTEDITSGSNTKTNTPASTTTTTTIKPVVTIEMEDGGKIKIELYPDVAPNTVNNFISLVQKGFYDGLTFHRVVTDFMIQGGDPKGDGTGDPGYGIKGEFRSNGFVNNLLHTRGVISMARGGSDKNSGGSQFFIMLKDTPALDGDYAAFGKVTEGLDVVDKIAATKTIEGSNQGENSEPVVKPKMKKVTVDTFGVTYKAPEKN